MTKLVSLSNEAYATLLKRKGKNMSFSDVVMAISKGKGDIMRFAGALKGVDVSEWKRRVAVDRKKNNGRKIKVL